jgi:hypothetical protein
VLKTPVLFIFFKRPLVTERVFKTIRAARPDRIFLAADGPLHNREGESEACRRTRATVEDMIDWPCEVHRLYREENLGCRVAVSSAIHWFFEHVEEGIILEDDTLPSESFFCFAEAMLARYRDDDHVMHVSGNNFQFGRIRGNGAYYASRLPHSWGWATWRRAWRLYDPQMSSFPEDWKEISEMCRLSEQVSDWWRTALSNTRKGVVDTWDFQWHYTVMKNQGVCLIPNRNLVTNIGVGETATHMKKRDVASSIKMGTLSRFDPPSLFQIDAKADRFDFNHSITNKKVYPRSIIDVLLSWKFKLQQAHLK